MPDSSILVREDEPTSIVAYTLNCTSYQTEIQQKSDTKSNKTLVDNSSILSVAVGGVVTDDEQPEPFVDNNDEDDNNDFYFSSLERYYFDDEENSSYHATTTTAASPSTSGGSSAALFVVTSFQQQQQHSPSFAYARQTLVQRVRQHHTHPHLGKLKTHWRTRFHHYHHTSTVPTRWKQFHGQVPSPLFNNNEEASGDASGGISSVSWDIQEERTIAQVDNNPAINEMIKELRLYNTIMTSSPHHRTVADESLINKNNTHTYSENKNLSPHIRHRFVHSNTEFTCIVYYAQEFEELRRRCGIEQMMIESLCRCQTWKTSGGKSKSRFYKTKDDRLVIKEMISSWNLAEKQQFLQFAPAYFDYMKRTTSEVPSVLTKIFGFFTIRITDNQKRATWAMDVMVMDHLFYNRTITQRFDFKGIRDRQVIIDRLQQHQQQQQHLTTLWDGDWIHGYQLVLNTTYYSKALIIDTALRNDAEFIEKCNIMDYSLLVGIDEQNREIIVGIVDFIGAYTWYKKIESKSKSTLKPQKQVTVLPPQQYRARFCREISTYFVPIPGKFDRIEPKEERNSFIASFCGFHMLK
ncbi:hypothetical protein BDA99DRAFT_90341 [Phascolomyces articulosus]|uniref:PIPK domain-containing protein n=1 Tax=Phascolomyces articulosus TaxID=60185 RepID=A0AAD5K889_9FUNG|nr:hypothetical protein BDA99DRAFT_90341 [Phascolomyces articulosus]